MSKEESRAFSVTVHSLNGAPLSRALVAKMQALVDVEMQAIVNEHERVVINIART